MVVQVDAALNLHSLSSASNPFPAIYPAPTWRQRDCVDNGNCSARGTCQDDGTCACRSGFAAAGYACVPIPEVDWTLNPDWLKGLALFFVALNAMLSLSGVAWTCWNRQTSVVKASQPRFLVLAALGCLVSSSSMLTLVVDEDGYLMGLQPSATTCTLGPWLYCIGFSLCFSSFLAKVVRIQVTRGAVACSGEATQQPAPGRALVTSPSPHTRQRPCLTRERTSPSGTPCPAADPPSRA